MKTHPEFRKVAVGVVTNSEMYALFGRYDGSPFNEARSTGRLWAGEWFEIEEKSYDYMLEVLPPLFYRSGMFGMIERKAGEVTNVFCAIMLNGRKRWFAGYCDMSVPGSPDALRDAIIARETAADFDVPRREEKLEVIWNATHPDFKGFAGSLNPNAYPPHQRGKRSLLVNGGAMGTCLSLLEDLSDQQIEDKYRLPRIYVPGHHS